MLVRFSATFLANEHIVGTLRAGRVERGRLMVGGATNGYMSAV